MKLQKYIIAAAFILTAMQPLEMTAKHVVTPKICMFGFAASFNDTIVHFTEIQAVDNVWMDKKKNFLLGRDQYSLMLRSYLTSQQMPYRTCVVFFDKKLGNLQKKYIKMKRLYSGTNKKGRKVQNNNDIRIISPNDFKFQTVNMGADSE